jgi:hypothetical protein
VHESLKERLTALFNTQDILAIETFLNRDGGFSFPGQIALVDTFVAIQEYMTASQMLEQCQKEWERNWAHQGSAIRGSPAAEGRVGIENTVAIENFYYSNGVSSSPLLGVPVDIPMREFVVLTRNSAYRFGAVSFNGTREVERDPTGLGFSCCILQPAATLGKALPIGHFTETQTAPLTWWTTPILDLK